MYTPQKCDYKYQLINKKKKKVCRYKKKLYLCTRKRGIKHYAEIAQLVEHDLAKVGVASSSLVFRSKEDKSIVFFFLAKHNS